MKNQSTKSICFISAILGIVLLYGSCQNCERTIRYMGMVPVYMHLNDLRAESFVENPRAMQNPGKIYVYGDLLLVNELNEGIHLIDNSNVSSPVPLKFIRIAGNMDIAVVDGYLYADQGPDLTVWDIQDVQNIGLVSRTKSILNRDRIKEDSFPIRYEEREIVEVEEDANCGYGGFWFGEVDFASSGGQNSGGGRGGQAGSMSRFTYVAGYIYIVDQSKLKALNVTNPSNPIVEGERDLSLEVQFGIEVETIYPYENNLFVGTTTGMLIFDRVVNPSRPVFISAFTHMRGCDPVVVFNDLAYVTLRRGSQCGSAENALHIVDISQLANPQLLISYNMDGPYGLAANKDLLMICDGASGLKTFNRAKTFELHNHLYSVINGKTTYDVILDSNHVVLSAKEGIFQYDYSNPESPVLLGSIFSR